MSTQLRNSVVSVQAQFVRFFPPFFLRRGSSSSGPPKKAADSFDGNNKKKVELLTDLVKEHPVAVPSDAQLVRNSPRIAH